MSDEWIRVGYIGKSSCTRGRGSDGGLTTVGGICARSDGNTTCRSSAGRTAAQLQGDLGLSPAALDVLAFAVALQAKILLFLPAVSGTLFLAGLVVFVFLKRDQKKSSSQAQAVRRRERLKQSLLGLTYGSVAFALASAIGLAQTVAGLTAVAKTSDGSRFAFDILAGASLQVLQWLALAFLALFALGASVMFYNVTGSAAASSAKGAEAAEAKAATK